MRSSSSHCLREDEELDLVDRIQLTQQIWHRTATNRAAAVHLLLNKPPGTFIIRDAVERKDACLMLSMVVSSQPKTRVCHVPIHKSPSQDGYRLHLSKSQKAFPDLTSLVVFYCSNGDRFFREQTILVLSSCDGPHLVLPKEILEAKTRQHLLALAHLGHYFWIPSLFGRSHSLPEDIGVSVSDGKASDSARRTNHASQRSLCSTPSSQSIFSSCMMSDGEEARAGQSRSVGHQSRLASVNGCGSYQDLLRISDDRSWYVSSSESGSDVINGIIYYSSQPQDKLSDYEDIWPSLSSPASNALPRAFPGSCVPSSPPRLPNPFATVHSLSSPVNVPLSSQHLNHVSSKCLSSADSQMPTSNGPVADADVHCTRSNQTQKDSSRIDLTKFQPNLETDAKRKESLSGFPQRLKCRRQCRRTRSKRSLLPNDETVQGDDQQQQQQQQQQENCNYNVTKIECQRLETTGVFHFDFQQTSRLASHVARVTRNSQHHLTSPDYALPYDALPCDAFPGVLKNAVASLNRPLASQTQGYLFTSLVDRNHRTFTSVPTHPLDCNRENNNNTVVKTVDLDFRNTAYYRSCRNNASAVISKTETDESRLQRTDLRPTGNNPKHCSMEMESDDDETMMEFGYRLPFDALPFGVSQGVGQLLPLHGVSHSVLASNSVSESSQADQGSVEDAGSKSALPRKKSLRASFSSAIQKKILRINQKKSRPDESLSCPEQQKTETLAVPPLISTHCPNGESRLAAGAATSTPMPEVEPFGSCSSLRRQAFQVVNLKRRRSVYDNVCTPSYYPQLNHCDIPKCGNISPYLGDGYSDISSCGDGSRPHSRRMTGASQMTMLSTATEYCQPWETIHWSQLLAQNSIPNSPWDPRVQMRCNHINPINSVQNTQRPSANNYCAEAEKVVDKRHHFPEEMNGTKDVCWSQKIVNGDYGKLVASKPIDQTNSSVSLSTTDNTYSISIRSDNRQCNLRNDLGRRFKDSAKEGDCHVVATKVTTCGAVPFYGSCSAADVSRISNDVTLCCSARHNRGSNQETLVASMSPDVIPQSASMQEPSPCRGGRGEEETTAATRICNYIKEMSQRREGFFGKMIRNFIECTRNATEKNPKNIVRNVRQFMTGLKNYLIHHGEDDLNDFIRSESGKMKSSEFLNFDAILDRVFEDCIIHPLQQHIYQLFVLSYTRDGQLQSMSDGIKFARSRTSFAELGLSPKSLSEGATSNALHFLTMMENSHSPTRKLLFLQGAIRAIDSEVETSKDLRHSVKNTEGLLSSLVCVLLEKGFVSAQIEIDYMQGLIAMSSSMTSEDSYHLGLFSCAVELIKNMNKKRPQANHNSAAILSDVLLTVYIPDEKYNNVINVGIPLRPNSMTRDICDMMAYKMKVTNPQDYGLFLLTEGNEIHLSDLVKISEFLSAEKVKASTAGATFRLIYKRINAKFIWPKSL